MTHMLSFLNYLVGKKYATKYREEWKTIGKIPPI
jgi:hypothetical protein